MRRSLVFVLSLAVVAGVAAFWLALARRPEEAWKLFLVNFIFWSGIAIAGVVFAAVLELSDGRWAGPVRRVAEGFASFLPVSFVLYFILLAGGPALYPWIDHPPPAHAAWFRFPAFVLRDTAALVVLYGLGLWFASVSRRKAEGNGSATRVTALAVALLIAYAFAFSLLAVDLVMSLDPSWASTLFPAYFFTGNLYAGIAATALASALRRRATGRPEWLAEPQAYDLGKLIFAMALLWTYLFWSQFLVIWYGNIPDDLRYVMVRTQAGWRTLGLVVLAFCFVVPCSVLLPRAAKRRVPVTIVASVCVSGIWMERVLLVVPSGHPGGATPWVGLPLTMGFAALFVLSQAVGWSGAARLE